MSGEGYIKDVVDFGVLLSVCYPDLYAVYSTTSIEGFCQQIGYDFDHDYFPRDGIENMWTHIKDNEDLHSLWML